jgi:hypothetical protein
VALVDQFRQLTASLPDDWDVARIWLTAEGDGDAKRAVNVLAPTNPGRHGRVIRFQTARRGVGLSPERLAGLLRRLDEERIHGTLELAEVLDEQVEAGNPHVSLAAAWDAAVASLPSDWSHAVGEVSLSSSDYVEPGALRLSPVNPLRHGSRPIFRFRVARTAGYGASPEMTHRCMKRLDEAGIRGSARIVNAVSDVFPAKTQGPVWYERGRVV